MAEKESIYCYYISSDFNFAELLVSIVSLQATQPRYEIACMYGKDVSPESLQVLRDLGIVLIDGTDIPLSHTIMTADGKKDEFLCSSKLYLYNLTQYKKIVYLDPDTYILMNIDSVFDFPDGSACKHFMNHTGWHNMNGGLMVVVPNKERFEEFQTQLKYDEAQGFHSFKDDQQYLTIKNHFTDRKDLHIPYEYNFWPFFIQQYQENLICDVGAVKMWHFMGGVTLYTGHYKVFTTPTLKLFSQKAQDYDWYYLEQAKLIITILKIKYPNVKSISYPGVYTNG